MPQKKLEIRPAKKSDSAQILFFVKELAKFEKLTHEVVATVPQIKKTLFGKDATAEVLLAYYQGRPAGFALFFPSYSTFLGRPGIYLEDLFVLPDLRRYGIGSKLLRELARIAKKRKCGRLEWSVLNWNQRAIDLYKKIGARPQSEWTVYRMSEKKFKKLAKG
ncbi:MAG: N-acetyltransferase family protein [Bdellovibrionota bacterium]